MSRVVYAACALAFAALVGCSSGPGEGARDQAAPVAAAEPPPAGGSSSSVVTGVVPAERDGMASIVVLEPAVEQEWPPQAGPPVMDQAGLAFTPSVLLVRTRQPAEFRNSDDVLHNVRVREEATKEGLFNVAIPTGGAYSHTFDRPGFYDVGCDIHPGMSAIVIATSTPFSVVADSSGRFEIPQVPPGAYRLTVYAGAATLHKDVTVSGARTEVNVS